MIVQRKPPAVLVVLKSFSVAQFIYPSEARRQVAFSCGRRGTAVVVDEELPCVKDTSSVSLRLPPSPTGEGLEKCVSLCVYHTDGGTSPSLPPEGGGRREPDGEGILPQRTLSVASRQLSHRASLSYTDIPALTAPTAACASHRRGWWS